MPVAPQILFEDEYLLAVNKPSGMVVNRGLPAGGLTMQDWVESNDKIQISKSKFDIGRLDLGFYQRSGVVHRLDKETSGVVLVAKTPEVFRALQRQFKAREVEKVYVGLVHGKVEPAEGVINAPTGRLPWRRTRFGVLPEGRGAVTKYRVLRYLEVRNERWKARFRGGKWDNRPDISLQSPASHIPRLTSFSLIEFYPQTGRTHQIRVHAKHIGHPIVADPLYAGRKTARRDRTWCPRLFLHAQELMFTHPVGGKRMTVEAPLPKDLARVLEHLG